MQYYEFIACRNDTGASLPYSKVTVYLTGTTTPASLFDSSGAGIANPVTATITGEVGFAAANGAYDIQIASADGTYLSPMIHKVQFYDLADLDAAIASLKTMTVSADRYQIKYDGTGTATPSAQTITFTATKRNTTATVTWTIADLAGNPVTPASTYLSAATGDTVTMTRPNFDTARGSTRGLIVTGTATDGSTLTSSVTIVVNQDGAAGVVGSHFTSTVPPSPNMGVNGDDWDDQVAQVYYPQKTANAWQRGFKYTAPVSVSQMTWFDFAAGALPAYLTMTRSQGSTDAFFDDVPGRVYNTVGANLPVFRNGMLWRGGYSKNFFLNSIAPVTQTITLAAGNYSFYGNGTGTINVALGTATGTVPGYALDLTTQSYQLFTIAAGGTITVTVTGTVNWVMVAGDDVTPNGPTPLGPLIVTAGAAVARNADVIAGTGTLLAMLQSGTGTFMIETYRVARGSGGQAQFLVQNNNAQLSYDGTNANLWNGGAYFVGATAGEAIPAANERMRWGFSFSSAGMSHGAGTKPVVTTGTATWPSPTSVSIGGGNNTLDTSATNGFIARIGFLTTRLSDAALSTELNMGTFALDTSDIKLPQWGLLKRNVKRGTSGGFLLCYGTSHFAGTQPAANTKAFAWPALLAQRLVTNGVPAASDCNFGLASIATGVNAYDNTVTLGAGVTGYGACPGGSGARLQSSTGTIDKMVARATDTFTVYVTRRTLAAGTPQISIGLTGGGSTTTFALANNNNIQSFTITVPRLPGNSFRIAWISGDVWVVGWSASDTKVPVVQVVTAGLPGNTAQNLNNQDILDTIAAMAPTLTVYGCVTNDYANAVALATFKQYTAANIDALQGSGDVLVMTDPPSTAATAALATQAKYNAAAIGCANAVGVPSIDLFGAMKGGQTPWNGNGMYFDNIHLNYTYGYPVVADFVAQTVR